MQTSDILFIAGLILSGLSIVVALIASPQVGPQLKPSRNRILPCCVLAFATFALSWPAWRYVSKPPQFDIGNRSLFFEIPHTAGTNNEELNRKILTKMDQTMRRWGGFIPQAAQLELTHDPPQIQMCFDSTTRLSRNILVFAVPLTPHNSDEQIMVQIAYDRAEETEALKFFNTKVVPMAREAIEDFVGPIALPQ